MLVAIAALFAGHLAFAWRFQRGIVFPGPRGPVCEGGADSSARPRLLHPRRVHCADDVAPGVDAVLSVSTDEGVSRAWWLLGDGRSAASPGPMVLFAHGNGESVDDWVEPLEAYRRAGVSVLLPEYRGYGRSDGSPTEAHLVDDATRLLDLALERPEVDRSRVVLHGRSLGSGVACGVAARRAPRVLVIQSGFASLARLMRRWLIPRPFVRDPFDNEAVLRDLDVPVLILHGTRDAVIPFSHGERLARAARNGTLHALDCAHSDCPFATLWQHIEPFLRAHGVLDE